MAIWQLNKRLLSILRLVIVLISILGILCMTIVVVLQTSWGQRKAAHWVSQEVSALLKMPAQVARVDLGFFEPIVISGIRLQDSLGRDALYADQLKAEVQLRSLFRERIQVSSLRLFKLKLLIDYSTEIGRTNIDPILRALEGDPTDSTSIELNLNSILLRDASIDYLVDGKTKEQIQEIGLKVDALQIAPNEVSAQLESLSFITRSGFKLQDLTSSVTLRGSKLSIQKLKAYLPSSYVHIPEAKLDVAQSGLSLLELVELKGLNLALKDLAPLYSPLADWQGDDLRLTAHIERRGHSFSLSNLEMSLANKAYLETFAQLQVDSLGIPVEFGLDIRKFLLDAKLLSLLPNYLPKIQKSALWDNLSSLGQISYLGKMVYQRSRYAHLEGRLLTDLGAWTTTAELDLDSTKLSKVKASLATSDFNMSPLLGPKFGRLQGNLLADLDFTKPSVYPQGSLQLQVKRFDWNNTIYRDAFADIEHLRSGRAKVSIGSREHSFPLSLSGNLVLQGKGIRDLDLLVRADDLPLAQWDKSLDHLSLDGRVKLSSLDLDKMTGDIDLSKLQINVQGKRLDLSNLRASLNTVDGERTLRLLAPWLKLDLIGAYRPKALFTDVLHTLSANVPILRPIILQKNVAPKTSRAHLNLQIDSIPQGISEILNLPVHLDHELRLSASLDAPLDSIHVEVNSSSIQLLKHHINDLSLRFNNRQLELRGNASFYGGTDLRGANLLLSAQDNVLSFVADLGRDSQGLEQGHIRLGASLSKADNKEIKRLKDLQVQLRVDPSKVRIHTNIWDIAPAKIAYVADALLVQGLSLSTEGRRLTMEGGFGTTTGLNTLRAEVENINLRYILEAVGVYFDLLDTDLTGVIEANLHQDHVVASAKVRSPHFYVNKVDVGATDLALKFSSQDLFIHINGLVNQAKGGRSLVDGWIKPAQGAGIDLRFDASDLDVSFVGTFMDSFLSKLEGRATGSARLHGLFEQGVTVSGEADIEQGLVGIRSLGTEYSFRHRLLLEDERIHLDGIQLYDDEGHSAKLRGYVGHQHFGNFDIQLQAEQLKSMKVLQTQSPKLMPAYGKAYATGSASMRGSEQRLLVEVDLISDKGTDVMLDFNAMTAGRDESLMRFVQLRPQTDTLHRDSLVAEAPKSTSIIDLNLRLNITPEAKLAMRLGDDNNSVLRGYAEGVLQISAPSGADPEVYGTLDVKGGEYVFNLQQLALKKFVLKPEGMVAFRGDATRANLKGLSAVYMLTANIADLDENISKLSQRTNIPVHCLLRLSGEVSNPEVRFGLELPGVDTEIERRVRSLLNSEDAITRQMIYLIALGRFYTNDNETRTTSTTNNWTSVASNAISEQLSSLLGGLSENIRLGTTIKTKSTAFDDTDIELNFSGSWLQNRLTINGNVGYHDNPYLNNRYLGEFEIEYKLKKPGSLRLKGYNRYNNMYQYLRQSLLRQGFGLLYRQRFDSLKDLLRPNRNLRDTTMTEQKIDSIRGTTEK